MLQASSPELAAISSQDGYSTNKTENIRNSRIYDITRKSRTSVRRLLVQLLVTRQPSAEHSDDLNRTVQMRRANNNGSKLIYTSQSVAKNYLKNNPMSFFSG